MKSRRMERVSRVLQQAVSRVIIEELSDPRMGFVTVTHVDPAPDLKSAKVFVSILGEAGEISRTMHGLRNAQRFIQGRVGRRVELKNVPVLDFIEDDSVKRSLRISRLIAKAVEEDSQNVEDDGETESSPGAETGPVDSGEESG